MTAGPSHPGDSNRWRRTIKGPRKGAVEHTFARERTSARTDPVTGPIGVLRADATIVTTRSRFGRKYGPFIADPSRDWLRVGAAGGAIGFGLATRTQFPVRRPRKPVRSRDLHRPSKAISVRAVIRAPNYGAKPV